MLPLPPPLKEEGRGTREHEKGHGIPLIWDP
jgi:hypothetical protein